MKTLSIAPVLAVLLLTMLRLSGTRPLACGEPCARRPTDRLRPPRCGSRLPSSCEKDFDLPPPRAARTDELTVTFVLEFAAQGSLVAAQCNRGLRNRWNRSAFNRAIAYDITSSCRKNTTAPPSLWL